jgi:dolichyl-diphosphooligosaccharide--protein glycosyltransferase
VGRLARGQLARFAPPAAAAVLALLVRALPWPLVFGASGIFPHGADAYYHLRRISYTVADFPRFLGFDPYVDFPDGGRPIWTPLFDFTLAALVRPWLGATTGAPLERVLVWVPPLLGAATVWVLWALARRSFGAGVAALAAALLALLPAHFLYSQLGELDHHVAVALAVALLYATTLPWLAPGAARPHGAARTALPLGLAQGFALLLWPGCLLAVALSTAALALRAATLPDRARAAELARGVALAQAIALLLVLPFAWSEPSPRWGSFSPLVLSRFQAAWFATGAAGFALLARFVARSQGERGRLLALLALGGGALVLWSPWLAGAARDSWGWLAKREVFQASVAESAPLLFGSAGFDPEMALMLFSRLFCVLPALLALAVLVPRQREERPARLFLAVSTAVWLATALDQQRFVNELSVPYALLVAVCAIDALRAARSRLAGRPRATALIGLGTIALALYAFAPVAAFYTPYLENLRRAGRSEPLRISGWEPEQRALTRLGRWLAEHTPVTSGYWDARLQPEYGVLAPWGDGHVLRYVAQRPMVQDNFGDDVGVRGFALAEAYFAAPDEDAGLRAAEQLRARYVVVRAGGSGHSPGYAPGSLYARLHLLNGAKGSFDAGPGSAKLELPALAHHRLIFDAAATWGASRGSAPNYKVFEIVPGARIRGRAQPGAHVAAELPLRIGSGVVFFSSETRAGADGSFTLRVPYANDGAPGDVRPGRRYRLRSGASDVFVVVSEADVESGADVAAPAFASR